MCVQFNNDIRMVGVSKYTLVFTLLIVVCVFFLTADGKKHFDEGDDPVKISLFIIFSCICTQIPQKYVALLQTFNI